MSTVTSAGIVSAVVALAASVAAIGGAVADSHRAQVAAELAAVAGATALYQGADACAVAARTAELNSATLEHCLLIDGHVTTTTAIPRTIRTATGHARAGPR